MGSPQALENVKHTYQWATEYGCTAAVVATNCMQYGIVKKMKPSYIEVFHDKEQAIAWLREKQAT